MTLAILVFAMLVVAVVLEIACLRCEGIPDNKLSLAGRRILIAGWILLAIRLSWIVLDGHPDTINPTSYIALVMIAFGNIVRCANRLKITSGVPARNNRGDPVFSRGPGSLFP